MEKLTCLVIFAALFAITCSFPSDDRDLIKSEWMQEARDNIQEKEDELETRNEMPCSEELGLLKHYHINLKSVPCSTTTKKRATNLLAREFKKQEFDFERQRNGYVRDFNSCCSPECDWLLDYLEIDSTVVKCLDRK
ncbi:uncharacterized protein LOC111329322 isoform X1 [Stylophora pistillata]|uniref:Uncharacterized protein n=1 Tax=Stylophora pistillata TaxID=50429 RepID=A0A2B4SAP1_STYPI|nr:uncharacterized protein LOC111329322 isoform X1 [Stylophora pistillata]PFX26169.1 hypothetical protein AWC38_SpisGene9155 [Stylophora pistillata]